MLRIAYLTHINLRGARGHTHNTLKTCEALQMASAEIDLITTDQRIPELADIFVRQNIQQPFRVEFLETVPYEKQNDLSPLKRWWAVLHMNLSFAGFLWRKRQSFDLVYYRYHQLFPAVWVWKYLLRKPAVFESHYVYIHKYVVQFLTSLAVRSADKVVAITEALRDFYHLSPERCLVAPCHAAEPELIPQMDQAQLRQELDVPLHAKILMYTGSLGATIQGISYEVETMVRVLPHLPESTISVIVGAREDKDVQALIQEATRLGVLSRVFIRPWASRIDVMKYLAAADVLMLPRVGTAPGSSPSKMFDYVAVGKPIVAATTPAVSEILEHEKNALLVDADQPEEWVQALQRLERDPALVERLQKGVQTTAQRYTWRARGQAILHFLAGYEPRS